MLKTPKRRILNQNYAELILEDFEGSKKIDSLSYFNNVPEEKQLVCLIGDDLIILIETEKDFNTLTHPKDHRPKTFILINISEKHFLKDSSSVG